MNSEVFSLQRINSWIYPKRINKEKISICDDDNDGVESLVLKNERIIIQHGCKASFDDIKLKAKELNIIPIF